MTNREALYESSFVPGSYLNRMLDCGNSKNQWVEIALCYLPQTVFDEHKEALAFIALTECDACRVAPQYREREIILLSERIFPPPGVSEGDSSARYFIFAVLHEVAHAILKHKSPKFDDLSRDEVETQEREADKLAFSWFNKHVERMGNLEVPLLTDEEVQREKSRTRRIMQGGGNGE